MSGKTQIIRSICTENTEVARDPEPQSDPLIEDLARILLTREQIAARVAELGRTISAEYQGKELVMVAVLKGSIYFLADLSRDLAIPHQIDLVGAQSYKAGTHPSPKIDITKDVDLDLQGRDVLLVEDIYDSGNTLRVVLDLLKM
jgi:hypoxanthine phosphoribosyltransferase